MPKLVGERQSLTVVALAIAVGLAMPLFLARVENWGTFVPRPDIQADYLVGLVWALVLGLSILIWPVTRRDRAALLVLWAAKCVVTLGVMLLYEHFYSVLDFHEYLREASRHSFPWSTVGLGSGTENIMALTWLHSYLLTPSYHAIKVSYAMAGLVGIFAFYRGLVLATGREDPRMLYFLGLFPSILFWSSILGKDPVILLGIGIYAYGVMGWSRYRGVRYLVLIGLGILLASLIRLWMGPILVAPLLIFALRGIRGLIPRAAFVTLTVVALVLVVARFAEMFGLETLQDVYLTTDTLSRSWGEGGSGQRVGVEFTGLRSMVMFAPLGAFTALFRPLPGEIMNPFGLLAGVESAFLLGLLVLAAVRARLAVLRQPLVLWAVTLVVVWAGIYGFISYQNLGSAVRFKLQILPVLVSLLLYLASKRPWLLPAGAERSRLSV